MELFFDTETSGFMTKRLHYAAWNNAWAVQLAMILSDRDHILGEFSVIIQSRGRSINPMAEKVHGISVKVSDQGLKESAVGEMYKALIMDKDFTFVCHNIAFDIPFLRGLLYRVFGEESYEMTNFPQLCTMTTSADLCKLPFPSGRSWGSQKYKWPKLEELHKVLFGNVFENAHDALADVRATRRCFYELIDRGIIKT